MKTHFVCSLLVHWRYLINDHLLKFSGVSLHPANQIYLVVLFSCLSMSLQGQCTTSESYDIPDNGFVNIDFYISGLTDSDLGSPTQGICGVEIDFMHEYLGDLTVTLISPSGTAVQLIGSPTTAISSTNLSRWNIQFIPCSDLSMPDAGFTPVWSNLQSWQAFTPYSGLYYPHIGCLEDFNSGSANGLWRLIVQDHDVLQTGAVASVTLVFCNPAGLQCLECDPNGGLFQQTLAALCEGDVLQSSLYPVDFQGNPPSPLLYTYEYFLSSGTTIIESGAQISASPSPGAYALCGISYLTADSAAVNNLLQSGDQNQLLQAIAGGQICAALSAQCVSITITPKPDTVMIDRTLCAGESFVFGGQSYSTEGVYFQQHDGPGSCDTTFRLQISQSDLMLQIDGPDTISCNPGTIDLVSIVSGNAGPIVYNWSTPTGNIVGPANTPGITVDQPGIYLLTILDGQCQVSASFTVEASGDFPRILLDGGTLTCTQTSVLLAPVYLPSDAIVQWTGPGGFSSNASAIQAVIPGTYNFTAMNNSGCSTTKSVFVNIDTTTHPIQIILVDKNCAAQTARITVTDASGIAALNWSGPNGFLANSHIITVTDPGLYQVNAIFINGCQRNSSFLFDGDFTIPDLNISPPDTLHCNETLDLTISSMTVGVSYAWSGPPGFSSSQATININQHGTYVGYVYAPNGCTNSAPVEITKGDDIFDFSFFSDTLDCKTDTVWIGVNAPEADIFHWVNLTGADTTSPTVPVLTAGVYEVIMVDTHSGCEVVTLIPVGSNFITPSFGYSAEPITCINPVSDLMFIPFQEFIYSSVHWELPDGSIVPGPVLSSDDPGLHKLIAYSPNGCSGTWQIYIPFDTLPPTFFAEADTLGCDLTASIRVLSIQALSDISWTGPGMFTSTSFTPTVQMPGIYHATGTALNGCSFTIQVEVIQNFDLPEIDLIADTLDCISDSVAITVITDDPILTYDIRDLSGNLIGNTAIVYTSDPGTYVATIEGTNNCINSDTVVLESPVYPSLTFIPDTLTCDVTTATLGIITDAVNPQFEWQDLSGNLLGQSAQLDVSTAGPFVATVTANNGCAKADTIAVPSDTVRPVAVIDLIGEIRCQMKDFMLDGNNSSPSPLDFQWSTIGGEIISADNGPVISARDTGVYFLVVIRQDNGCIDSVSIQMSEHPDAIQQAFFDIMPESCSGDADGSIHLVAIQGGVLPVLSQINGGPLQGVGFYEGLSAGTYLFTVIDAEGCEYDTTLEISSTNPFMVNAGEDEEIYLGDDIGLSGEGNIDTAFIVQQSWSLGDSVLCLCPEITANPQETTTYTYQVVSSTGCVMEDQVTVFVLERAKYYIPNVFSPNGDNINDQLTIHAGSGIETVLKWIIYDRWGDAVFGRTNFDPHGAVVSWDGRNQDGETLNPGVFPYLLEVRLINGNMEIHHGTITLIR